MVGRLDTMTDEEWQFSMDVNLTSAMRLSRFADRHMVSASSQVDVMRTSRVILHRRQVLHGLMVSDALAMEKN